jgi:xanthine dehydrogenase YagR molybdenum-binding subunit
MDQVLPPAIGQPANRVEGRAKVTGAARYAADYPFDNLAYGVLVTSAITKGRISAIDTSAADKIPGVISILSHLNCPEVPGRDENPSSKIPIFSGSEFKPFQDNRVYFNLQPIALVIAESFEAARAAATLVKISYEQEEHDTAFENNLKSAITPDKPSDYSRGQAYMLEHSPVIVNEIYRTSIQVQNPLEPHAATAYWEGDDKLYIFNKTQSVKTTQQQFAQYFKLKPENVKVIAPFVGGAFGSASRMWPHEIAAVLGARQTNRPVKVVAAREQVFNMVGYRPYSLQKYCVGASADGTLITIGHEAYGSTSRYEQFMERILDPTKSMYNCANVQTRYQLVPLDLSTPCPARGPGETSGSFAMESAMDELAYSLNMDPLQLRLKNLPEIDLANNKPWSSNHLRECLETGAKKFGWERRNPQPGSMHNGNLRIGMGMSGGIYKAERTSAFCSIKVVADGTVLIRSSVADTGPGSATVLTQIAADALGVDHKQVSIEWGNSEYPFAPPQYGSHTTASVGSAVYDAAVSLRSKFMGMATLDGDSLLINYCEILKERGLPELETTIESKPGPESEKYSSKSFCANFVEVRVDEQTGEIRVKKVVSVVDSGKIMNYKTARSQVLGSVVWGIGIALMEEGIIDDRYGRYVNNNLEDYLLPVNADIPDIEVHFIDKDDPVISPTGAKGLGEIALIGLTAAIANAVCHATGKRMRKLPITLDQMI